MSNHQDPNMQDDQQAQTGDVSTEDTIREQAEALEKDKAEEKQLKEELQQGEAKDLQEDPPKDATDKFTRDVETELTFHILNNMRHGEISEEDADRLADEFLSLLPAKDKEDLLSKLDKLGQTFSEAKQTFATYVVPHEEEKRLQALEEMRKHIQSGNIEQAIAVAKGGK